MGLNFRAKHLDDSALVECGYFSFGRYRMKVAYAIDPLFGLMYEGFYGAHWEKEDDGYEYADTYVNIEDYVRENIEIEDEDWYDKIGNRHLLPPEIQELEDKISEWVNGSAISDVKIARYYYSSKGHKLVFRLNWEEMQQWIEDNLTDIQEEFFFAPDCDGKWSWQQCRDLYKTFENYDVVAPYRQSYDHEEDMHKRMLDTWKACWKNRVQLTWN